MFINELNIYITFINEQLSTVDFEDTKMMKYYRTFCKNMHDAVDYYRSHTDRIFSSCAEGKDMFMRELQKIEHKITGVESSCVKE